MTYDPKPPAKETEPGAVFKPVRSVWLGVGTFFLAFGSPVWLAYLARFLEWAGMF